MVQGDDTLNKKQSRPCRHLCPGLLLFLNHFFCFFLLLLLNHSGKLAIPHDHILLLVQNIHCVLFNSMQDQVNMSISVDIHIVFWWAIYGNRSYHSWGDLIYLLFGTDFLQSIFNRYFQFFFSSCCNNETIIALLLVVGRKPSLMDGLIWVRNVRWQE